MEYMQGFKPLVKVSYKHIESEGVVYKRRLRINAFNMHLINQLLDRKMIFNHEVSICIWDKKHLKKICSFLCVEYKDVPTYLFIDFSMCAFSQVP